jgi:hypothetical protein
VIMMVLGVVGNGRRPNWNWSSWEWRRSVRDLLRADVQGSSRRVDSGMSGSGGGGE